MSDDVLLHGFTGDKEVINSGNIIWDHAQEAIIVPFPPENYKLKISFEITDGDHGAQVLPNEGGPPILRIFSPWVGSAPVANIDLNIANNDGYEFYISFIYNTVGIKERYAVYLSYQISRKSK